MAKKARLHRKEAEITMVFPIAHKSAISLSYAQIRCVTFQRLQENLIDTAHKLAQNSFKLKFYTAPSNYLQHRTYDPSLNEARTRAYRKAQGIAVETKNCVKR